ncbi:MAG: Holliday junction branch migration protein RuvA [Brevibacterium sp.]|uniref:Holliday junction branch migration protein RuvA n=1 Tax=Brevibacterium sandarakinum TaxID=629680 RepID=UPI002651081D|nr:Holliday junction branch migration protein RuvA [Brevibacterium sandarakinum]MDN5588388.1 Holliday junction branch migration protein RuvA [Brevibacterium sp.]MDN5634920.1 Holliday junction branch migration protein RuvA [Brevibacterium sp.]MDN5657212.1 Holliday junction branch migration protein RuvA [Brevibacterium sandarakinum]
MISFLSGTVHRIAADHLVIVTYGVGRKVNVTPDTLSSTRHGADIELVTTLVVREDSMTLFGFGTEDENHTFEVLLSISGIGPRLAMAILSVMGPDELAAAISSQDANALTRVPGIGKKGASRIILELENKLPKLAASEPGPQLSFGGANQQVVDALVGLGWKEAQAADVVQEVVKDLGQSAGTSTLLKAALKVLGARK